MPSRLGPGWAVAAAFLGPGTVTTALVAGGAFGMELLWAIPVSAVVTFVLQEAAARVTLAGGRTLGDVVPDLAPDRLAGPVAALLLVAVVGGAAAFQVGNLLGAAIALDAAAGLPAWWTVIVVADVAFLVLWFGGADRIGDILGVLVAAMAVAFVAELLIVPVDWGAVADGLVPTVPAGAIAVVVALVGTTVVPYNLFLHGSLAEDRGWGVDDIGAMRRDLGLSIAVGAVLTGSLVVVGATVLTGRPEQGVDLAVTLRPLLGDLALTVFGVGLLAAAFTSSVTAPLAAAYVASDVLGYEEGSGGARFRATWAGVLLLGTALAVVGLEPIAAIVAAQAANGLVLPLVAIAILVAVNRVDLVADRVNDRWQNLAGVAAVAVATLLGAWLVWSSLP